MNIKKQCKISITSRETVKELSKEQKVYPSKIYEKILYTFFNVYKLNSVESGYLDFLNNEYLVKTISKSINNPKENTNIWIYLPQDMIDMYNNICKDYPKYKVRLLELACFYYFNILPKEMR